MTVGVKMQEDATEAGHEKVESSSDAKQKTMTAGEGSASYNVENLSNQKCNVSGPDTPIREEDGRLAVEVRGQRKTSSCFLLYLHDRTVLVSLFIRSLGPHKHFLRPQDVAGDGEND